MSRGGPERRRPSRWSTCRRRTGEVDAEAFELGGGVAVHKDEVEVVAQVALDGLDGSVISEGAHQHGRVVPLLDEVGDRIRDTAHEYGTVTGRPRRVGWFDSVALRHAKRVSGINGLSLNLLDVFSGFDKIKIATAYELDGKKIDYYPASLKELYRCKPVYEELPAWDEDITQVKTWDALPENAKKFLNRVSELVGVPLVTVSVGPDREQTIVLKNPWEM